MAVFPVWESRNPRPMMPPFFLFFVTVFAARHFAVGNLATVFLLCGGIGSAR